MHESSGLRVRDRAWGAARFSNRLTDGAALAARRRFGTEPGVGLGYRGAAPAHSWSIPTKDAAILSLPLEAVKTHVQAFDLDTLAHPEQRYFVTRVGCGLAGNRDAEMAPLFLSGAIGRCSFPLKWRRYLRPQGMCYAGIGARNAPSEVLSLITRIARRLAARGFILRSGAAETAVMAFEAGCDASEIFLPWPGFNGSGSPLDNPSAAALVVAQAVHPAFERLSPAAQKLMARNSYQILGPDLRTPADFVVCWTPDGAETEDQRTPLTGRTGQAIALADRWSVPVFNLTRPGALLRIGEHISGCA